MAIIPATSPSDVVLVRSHGRLATTTAAPAGSLLQCIPLARVNQPLLTVWLQDAINRLLRGAPPDRPRPTGSMIERGTFAQDGTQVLAGDWYGRGNWLPVARCTDAEAARQLADQLNAALLGAS